MGGLDAQGNRSRISLDPCRPDGISRVESFKREIDLLVVLARAERRANREVISYLV